MRSVLFVVIPVLTYVIGILCGRWSVKRTAEEGIRLHNASVKARITGMQIAMSAESQRADEHSYGQRAMIDHLETMLRAHTEYSQGLAETANALRLDLTRYILGEVPEAEIIEARANLLTMMTQNETRAAHAQEPLILPDPTPVETKNRNHICDTPGTDCPRCGSCGADLRNIRYTVKYTQAEYDAAKIAGTFGPLPCPDPWHDRPGDFEAADNYVAEGFVSFVPDPSNERVISTVYTELPATIPGDRREFNDTQIELSRRHPRNCDCAYCLHVGD